MENKTVEKTNLLEKVTSFIVQKKKTFATILILIIITIFSLVFFKYL